MQAAHVSFARVDAFKQTRCNYSMSAFHNNTKMSGPRPTDTICGQSCIHPLDSRDLDKWPFDLYGSSLSWMCDINTFTTFKLRAAVC